MKRFIVLLSAMILCLILAGCSGSQYKKATELYEQGNYAEAGEIFSKLGNYEDSADKVNECKYQEASALLQNSDYDDAKALFSALGDYGDSADKVKFCDYKKAEKLLADDDYDAAKAIFSALGSYENSADQVKECDYEKADALFKDKNYEDALAIYETIADYKDAQDRIDTATSKILYKTYGDVIDLLNEGAWFFNGGSDHIVTRLLFSYETATITTITFDGNGRHDGSNNFYAYTLDDKEITIKNKGSVYRVIPYSVKDGKLKLGEGDYFTPDEVDAGLQGYWSLKGKSSFINKDSEEIYYFNNGKLTYEYAAESFWSADEYFYYGPYSGTYKITSDGISATTNNTDIIRDRMFGFNIINGKVTLLIAGTPCKTCSGFKGEYGNWFN